MEEPSPEASREKTEMPCAFMLSDNGLAWWTLWRCCQVPRELLLLHIHLT